MTCLRAVAVGTAMLSLAARGAAAQPRPAASAGPSSTVRLEYKVIGLAVMDGDDVGCARGRRNGTRTMTATLTGMGRGTFSYGTGRFVADVDFCEITRQGATIGEFRNCIVTAKIDHPVSVELTLDGRVSFKWRRTGSPELAQVTGDCDAKVMAGAAASFSNGGYLSVQDEELTRQMLTGRVLREGTYRGDNDGRGAPWILTIGTAPEDEPRIAAVVSIEGPACACLDGEKVPGAQVSWSASASQGGGTFGPFTVRTAGPAPKVVSNSGGATGARITLEPTRATQAVTLTATYTHKGRALTATHNVDFCVFDSTRIGDGLRDFAFDDASPGKLEITARSRAVYNGADVSAELAWEFEPIGGTSTTTMTPASPTGGVADVTYTGLPEFNAAFGKKRIEVSLDKGACACKRTDSFRAFYSPTATNHPPPPLGIAQGTSPVPNWFYYYAQTPALAGVPGVLYAPKLFSRVDNRPANAQFNESDGNIYLADLLWQSVCRPSVPQGGKPVAPSGAGNDGIDCVAETVRHEAQHRADLAAWWPNGYLVPADPDTDGVPLLVEAARPGCSSMSKASCDERPFTDVGDLEINAYWVGWRWPTGSINAQDWACGAKGKQWKGGPCGKE